MTRQEISVLVGQDAIGGAQQHRQPRVDEVDLRQRQRQIAAEHDSLVQGVVHDVEERRAVSLEDAFCNCLRGSFRVVRSPA